MGGVVWMGRGKFDLALALGEARLASGRGTSRFFKRQPSGPLGWKRGRAFWESVGGDTCRKIPSDPRCPFGWEAPHGAQTTEYRA